MIARVFRGFSSVKKADFFWRDINDGVRNAEYAVRGLVPSTATLMQGEIDKGTKSTSQPNSAYPFDSITFCNIGNPQEFHQKPITFYRQVVACLLDPSLIHLNGINKDAADRAQRYLKQIISAGSYTHSLGIPLVRESVSKFIAQDDQVPAPSTD